jgi:hypothetical protein
MRARTDMGEREGGRRSCKTEPRSASSICFCLRGRSLVVGAPTTMMVAACHTVVCVVCVSPELAPIHEFPPSLPYPSPRVALSRCHMTTWTNGADLGINPTVAIPAKWSL